MKKTVLMTGATGMVGSQILHLLLGNKEVEKIISIGRRKCGQVSQKLTEIIHEDFHDFSKLKSVLINMDVCFYCLGVYQNQVNKKKFFEITCEFQKALTDVLEVNNPNLTFCLFGASGADPTEKSKMRFAKAKGRAENLLNASSFSTKYIFRPGYIHPTGNKKPTNWLYKYIGLPLGKTLFKIFPSAGITDRDLAKLMVKTGIESKLPSRIFENKDMRKELEKHP